MATPNLDIIFQAILAVLDASGAQNASFDLENPTIGVTAAFMDQNFQAFAAPTSVQFPAVNMFAMIVQNKGTTPLNIRFSPFPLGFTAVNIGPNGLFIMIDPTETGTGFWALQLSGLTVTVPAFVVVGA